MRYVAGVISCLLALTTVGCGSKKKPNLTPPPSVVQTLRTLYPRVSPDSARWEWDKDGYFEGHFRLDGLPHKLRVDTTGRYLETEVDVARTALPVPLQDTLQAQINRYHDPKRFRVREVSIVRLADGTVEYEAHVRVENKWRKRFYDATGKLVREGKAPKG